MGVADLIKKFESIGKEEKSEKAVENESDVVPMTSKETELSSKRSEDEEESLEERNTADEESVKEETANEDSERQISVTEEAESGATQVEVNIENDLKPTNATQDEGETPSKDVFEQETTEINSIAKNDEKTGSAVVEDEVSSSNDLKGQNVSPEEAENEVSPETEQEGSVVTKNDADATNEPQESIDNDAVDSLRPL